MNFQEQYEAAKRANALVNTEPKFLKLEAEGQSMIGRLMGFDEVQSSQGPGKFNMYVFQTDDGMVKTKFGAATDKMTAKFLKIGTIYFIQFLGQQKLPNGTDVNRFRIEEVPEFIEETHKVSEDVNSKKKGK
jgi:hypothetical protein